MALVDKHKVKRQRLDRICEGKHWCILQDIPRNIFLKENFPVFHLCVFFMESKFSTNDLVEIQHKSEDCTSVIYFCLLVACN